MKDIPNAEAVAKSIADISLTRGWLIDLLNALSIELLDQDMSTRINFVNAVKSELTEETKGFLWVLGQRD
jgi:hypothetical protein